VKARCFFAAVAVMASTALLVAAASGKPPGGFTPSPVSPSPGSPGAGLGAVIGKPGTITITHYSADGKTVLGTERVKASASDTSASVAAQLGKVAPAPAKAGAVTLWDDAGRPGAPAKQAESAPAARTTASVKSLLRRADCCSPSGCDAIEVTRDIDSDVFGTWLGTFHHRVYWCWSYPKITGVNVSCWSTVDGSYIEDRGCSGWGNYYRWSGSNRGGHHSFRQGDWGNCVWWLGCFGNIYPWIEIWVNGNGAWGQDQGG
jgi:hypothetical protein